MEAGDGKEETPLPSALSRFQLSEDYGFLLPSPLVGGGRATVPVGKTELPAPYGPWMEIARELPQLIASHRLRSRVHQVNARPLLASARPQPWSGIAVSGRIPVHGQLCVSQCVLLLP